MFIKPQSEFWMLWVQGTGKPCKRYRSLEAAEADAFILRRDVTKRHVYILHAIEMLEGRDMLRLRTQKEVDEIAIV